MGKRALIRSRRSRTVRISVLLSLMVYWVVAPAPTASAVDNTTVGSNIHVSSGADNDPQNETTIAVNPTDPLNLIGGANDYRGGGDSGCGNYHSEDGGQTWTDEGLLPLVSSSFNGAGDPVVEFAADGTAYYLCMNYLRNSGGNVTGHTQYVRTSTDGGANWGGAVLAGGGPLANNDDKGHIKVDDVAGSPHLGDVYVAWTRLNTGDVRFSRSTDGAASFIDEQTVSDADGFGANVAVGADGDVYVAWQQCCDATHNGNMMIDKSTDGGDNFGALLGGVDHVISPFNAIGESGTSTRPLDRANGLPVLGTHPTNADTIYALWATDPMGADDSDIMFARSTDGGETWGVPVRVNDDINPVGDFNSQFFPWMSVDPTDGEIDIVWYSDENDPDKTDGTPLVDLYFTTSSNGGTSFEPRVRVSTESSDPTVQFGTSAFFGDYNGIDSFDGKAYTMWTDSRDGTQDAFFAQIGADQADLSLTKSDSADPVAAGDEFSYTIVVGNDGPAQADNVIVTDTLPSAVDFVSSSPACSQAGNVLTCDLGDIPSGGSETLVITVRTDRGLVYNNGGPVTLTNEAEVDSDAQDPDTSDNSDTEDTQVIARADLEIVSFDAQNPPSEMLVGAPQDVTLRKVITNNGPSAPMDVHLELDAAASPGATVTPANQSFDEPALGYQEQRTVDEEVTIECQAPGSHSFTFDNEIQPKNAPTDEDPDQSNNTAQESFTVNCITPVIINIKPGSKENPVNLGADGVIPVGILTTSAGEYGLPLAFDATTVDPHSLRFGKREVVLAGGGAPEDHGQIHPEDVYEMDERTKDGDIDVMSHFRTQLTMLNGSDTEACLRGTYSDGLMTFMFFGCDKIRTMHD